MSSFAGMCDAIRGGTKAEQGKGYPSPCFCKFGLELSPILEDLAYTLLRGNLGYIVLPLCRSPDYMFLQFWKIYSKPFSDFREFDELHFLPLRRI
jgi:hypothetical protein